MHVFHLPRHECDIVKAMIKNKISSVLIEDTIKRVENDMGSWSKQIKYFRVILKGGGVGDK